MCSLKKRIGHLTGETQIYINACEYIATCVSYVFVMPTTELVLCFPVTFDIIFHSFPLCTANFEQSKMNWNACSGLEVV